MQLSPLTYLGFVAIVLAAGALVWMLIWVQRDRLRQQADLAAVLPATILFSENVVSFPDASKDFAVYRRSQVRRIYADRLIGFNFRSIVPRTTIDGGVIQQARIPEVRCSDNLVVVELPLPGGGSLIEAAFKKPARAGDVVEVWVESELDGYFPQEEEFLSVGTILPTDMQTVRITSSARPLSRVWFEVRQRDSTGSPVVSISPQTGLAVPPVGTVGAVPAANGGRYLEIEWRIPKPSVGFKYVVHWSWSPLTPSPPKTDGR
jgi:hypothetical protein